MLNLISYHKMQIKTTSTRMAIINNIGNNKAWPRCGETGIHHVWWECKMVQPLWKTVWQFLKRLKIKLSYDLAGPLLGLYSGEMKTRHIVHGSIIHHSQYLGAIQRSIS